MCFLITGLPRSRTAWLANFMSYDGYLCKHEALLDGVEDTANWLQDASHGDSDSGLTIYWETLLPRLDNPKLVVINRNFSDVYFSLSKFLSHIREITPESVSDVLQKMQLGLKELKKRKHLEIQYDELSNLETLKTVWRYCTGKELDETRAKIIIGLNVQQIIP